MRLISSLSLMLSLFVCFGSSKSEVSHEGTDARATLAISIRVDYPLPGAPDILNLRDCPLTGIYQEVTCRLIGTQGPVRKITWPDTHLKVPEASVEYNKLGNIARICRRGHVDFQGWSCGSGPFAVAPLLMQTELDSHGRILRRQHDPFDKTKFDTCTYDDKSVPRTSECRVDGFTYQYSFDNLGRALSYSTRFIPVEGKSEEEARYLDKAYALDLIYSYKNDKYGNWVEFKVTKIDPASGAQKVLIVQPRDIDYY